MTTVERIFHVKGLSRHFFFYDLVLYKVGPEIFHTHIFEAKGA